MYSKPVLVVDDEPSIRNLVQLVCQRRGMYCAQAADARQAAEMLDAETVDFDHIKRHYFVTHTKINPLRIVPRGPDLDLDAPHGRNAI